MKLSFPVGIFLACLGSLPTDDALTDRSRLLGLVRELVAANSENPPGREAEAAKVLRSHMEANGLSWTSVGPKERPNLVVTTDLVGKARLVIHGHLDTVPVGPVDSWSHDPFQCESVGGRIYGRGTCDMKGPLAALAETMIVYAGEKHARPLLMLTTSDEESGCSGAEEVASSGMLAGVEYGVCAEPTNLEVLVSEKGMLWVRVIAEGRSAHGSRPEEGINAIQLCIEALKILTKRRYEFEPDALMGKPTLNIGVIQGGIKINVVPDRCEALVDMRLVKGQTTESVLTQMRGRLESAGLSERVKVEYVHGLPAVITPVDTEIVSASLEAVERVTGRRQRPRAATFGTDCSILQPKIGILNVICGPGAIEQAHRPDEYISVEQLVSSVDVYLHIARHFANDLS